VVGIWDICDGLSAPKKVVGSVSLGVGGLVADIGIWGLDLESWANTDFATLCGSSVAAVSETSKSVVVTKW